MIKFADVASDDCMILLTGKSLRRTILELANHTLRASDNVLFDFTATTGTATTGEDVNKRYRILKKSLISGLLGKPTCTMQFESNPGVWVFYDCREKAIHLLFSDSHKKNAFKGSSIETACLNGGDYSSKVAYVNRLSGRLIGMLLGKVTLVKNEMNLVEFWKANDLSKEFAVDLVS